VDHTIWMHELHSESVSSNSNLLVKDCANLHIYGQYMSLLLCYVANILKIEVKEPYYDIVGFCLQ